jgi:nicotinate-nucleotide adenylyltransferase
MGADAFTNLPTWKHWQDLLSFMNFAVASRPEHSIEAELTPVLAELLAQHQCQSPAELENHPCGEIFIDDTLAVDVSSTALREQLQNPATYDLATACIPSHALEIISNLGLYK